VPLAQRVTFQGALEKCNKVQIPKLIRWQFKLETDQVLKVGVRLQDSYGSLQFYYARMTKDGRIRVPRLVLSILQDEKPIVAGCILEVTLEPA
jgi:hypothetical protein